ncbi:MAG: hypothetical protein ACXWWL_04890 [Candidatus Limnocylindria bacterium]
MRSPLGPVLVIIGLATILVLVLVIFQVVALGTDADRIGEELDALRADVAAIEPGIDRDELQRQLEITESAIRDWLIATGADGFDPDATPNAGQDGGDVNDRLDEILDRLEALDRRLDQICEGVPVC